MALVLSSAAALCFPLVVRYLLDAANALFPAAGLTEADVVSTWAGLRPLVAAGIPYVAVLPYPEPDSVWPDESRRRFKLLLDEAALLRMVEGR